MKVVVPVPARGVGDVQVRSVVRQEVPVDGELTVVPQPKRSVPGGIATVDLE